MGPARRPPQDPPATPGGSGLLLGWPLAQPRPSIGFTSRGAVQSLPPADGPYTDDSEAHCLVVAPTGAGKGRNVVLPNLLHWPHGVVVVDLKGEAAMTTARYRRSLGQRVVVLDPFKRVESDPDTLNPLDWLGASPDDLADNATTLSETITGNRRSEKEPFWDDLANDLVAGLMACAATTLDPARHTLGWVHEVLTDEHPYQAIARLLAQKRELHPFAQRQLAAFMNHERDKVASSVRSTAQQHLRLFGNPLVQASSARTSFDLAAFQRGEPVSIYLVLPASRMESHAGLMRIWLTVLLGLVAERSRQPHAPTLLIVDELAQLGGMKQILQALTLLRGYGLRVMAVLQSLAQLKSLWPQEHQTVLDNCGTVLSFGQTRLTMAGPMAELLGDLSADALLQLPAEQMAVSRAGHPTLIARKLDYLRDPLFSGRFDRNVMHEPEPPAGPDTAADEAAARRASTSQRQALLRLVPGAARAGQAQVQAGAQPQAPSTRTRPAEAPLLPRQARPPDDASGAGRSGSGQEGEAPRQPQDHGGDGGGQHG